MSAKTEIPGIYKIEEGVLVNKDMDGLQAYRNRKMRERKLIRIEEDLKIVKKDVEEIKAFMRGFGK